MNEISNDILIEISERFTDCKSLINYYNSNKETKDVLNYYVKLFPDNVVRNYIVNKNCISYLIFLITDNYNISEYLLDLYKEDKKTAILYTRYLKNKYNESNNNLEIVYNYLLAYMNNNKDETYLYPIACYTNNTNILTNLKEYDILKNTDVEYFKNIIKQDYQNGSDENKLKDKLLNIKDKYNNMFIYDNYNYPNKNIIEYIISNFKILFYNLEDIVFVFFSLDEQVAEEFYTVYDYYFRIIMQVYTFNSYIKFNNNIDQELVNYLIKYLELFLFTGLDDEISYLYSYSRVNDYDIFENHDIDKINNLLKTNNMYKTSIVFNKLNNKINKVNSFTYIDEIETNPIELYINCYTKDENFINYVDSRIYDFNNNKSSNNQYLLIFYMLKYLYNYIHILNIEIDPSYDSVINRLYLQYLMLINNIDVFKVGVDVMNINARNDILNSSIINSRYNKSIIKYILNNEKNYFTNEQLNTFINEIYSYMINIIYCLLYGKDYLNNTVFGKSIIYLLKYLFLIGTDDELYNVLNMYRDSKDFYQLDVAYSHKDKIFNNIFIENVQLYTYYPNVINNILNMDYVQYDNYEDYKDNPNIVNVLEILKNNNLIKTHNFIKQSIIDKL